MLNRPALPFIAASAVCAVASAQSVTWEILARQSSDVNVAGVPTAVWVPGNFNNGSIDNDGRVIVSNTIQNDAGTLTNASNRVVMRGVPGSLQLIARNGSPAPAGAPTGAVFNTSSGINGITTSYSNSSSGFMMVAGALNGGSVVHTAGSSQNNSALWLFGPDGASYLLGIVGMQAPGASAGTYLTSAFNSTNLSTSAARFNTSGKLAYYSSTAGGDTVTTGTGANNNGIWLLGTGGPASAQLVFRKGQAAPGYSDGTYLATVSSFPYLNEGALAVTATLGGAAVNAANDACALLWRDGQPSRVAVREGDAVYGLPGLTFTGTFSAIGRGISADGRFLFTATVAGAGVTTANDYVFCMYDPSGASRVIAREGDTGGPWGASSFSNVNGTGLCFTATNHIIFNAGLTSVNQMVDYDVASSTYTTILTGGDQAFGLPSGVLYTSFYAGSSSPQINAKGEMVVKLPLTGSVTSGVDDTALYAWSASTGLRPLLRSGTTGPTGFTVVSFFPPGNAAMNGSGGSNGLSETGWFVTNLQDNNPASATGTDYSLVRARVFAPPPACPADLTGDGQVDGADLGALLGAWGPCSGSCPADLTGDGQVDGADLGALLGAWGPCPV
ncbi:MAG: choice-of-anchor tandem repeat NxxGxxAF-containing protein [Planctomycetota bacterium]